MLWSLHSDFIHPYTMQCNNLLKCQNLKRKIKIKEIKEKKKNSFCYKITKVKVKVEKEYE